MTTDSPSWDAARWRDGQQLAYQDDIETLRASVQSAVDQDQEKATWNSYSQAWTPQSRIEVDKRAQELPALTEAHADASTYQTWSEERHNPSATRKYDLQNSTRLPEPAPAWRSLRYDSDDRRNEQRTTDVPLTLHIPKSHDLPRTPPGYTRPSSGPHSSTPPGSWSQHATSLPSFASLQEHAGRRNDFEDDGSGPLSTPPPCHLCTKLMSRVREVAIAVSELDDEVQTSCNKSNKRSSVVPTDSSLSAVQWILDTLRTAKDDLQAARRTSVGYGYQPGSLSISGERTRNMSPPNVLKRAADRWDQDELPIPKRPRSGPSPEEGHEQASVRAVDQRRASIDFITRDQFQRPGLSPPASDSLPNSAYPRTASPGRLGRTLPSPSSTAYPPSAAPSLAHQTSQFMGSPTLSSQRDSFVYTGSATSAHIAELQHQVTLKSLALQTLESEYTSLLQKIQRLNIKTQTMERKSNVADQEVNELTTKNEDLTQQLQSLQDQLDESEKRREKEREEAGREKDQWLQMLDQGRRIQAKLEDDKRNLTQEINSLKSDMNRFQQERDASLANIRKESAPLEGPRNRSSGRTDPGTPFQTPTSDEITAKEAAALNAKIEILRRSLEEAKRHNQVLDERASDVAQRSAQLGQIIDRALDEGVSTNQSNIPSNSGGQVFQSGRQSPQSARESRPSSAHKRTPRAGPTDQGKASIPPRQFTSSIVQSPNPSLNEPGPYTDPDPSSSGLTSEPRSTVSSAFATGQYSRPHMFGSTDSRSNSSLRQNPWGGQQFSTSGDVWSTTGYGQRGEPNDSVSLGSFRPLNQDILAGQKPILNCTAMSPQSGQGSPSPDSSSTSTKSASGQSPGSSWAATDSQFGADLTPVSTLPTPGSASSSKLYQTYSFERRQSIETAGTMPPPPRPIGQNVEPDSTRG